MKVDPFEPPTPETTYVGPFDREPWPDRLVAHVVEPGPVPRIHGYDATALARGHGIADVAWLLISGELPSAEQRAAFELVVVLLAPLHIGEAPSHAAFLSRIAGAPPATTLAIAAVGLGELVRHEQAELAPWLRWLAGLAGAGDAWGEVPAVALDPAPTSESRALQRWVDSKLRAWFGSDRGLPDVPLHRVACAYAVLQRLALRSPLAIEAIAVWARLLAIAAEAAHARTGDVRRYPARLPDYQYVDAAGATP